MTACAARVSAETIASALEGKRYADGWRSACPVHGGDSGSSFSIRESPDGKVLLHCFAGCDQQAVIEALRSRGLWPDHRHDEPVERRSAPRVDRLAIMRECWQELHVLQQVIGARIDAYDPHVPQFMRATPGTRSKIDKPWGRELIAVRRLRKQLDVLYGEVTDA